MKNDLKEQDFFDAIAQPPMNDICYHISAAVYLAKDGGKFTNEEAKWFIENIIKTIPDNEILKPQKEDDDE